MSSVASILTGVPAALNPDLYTGGGGAGCNFTQLNVYNAASNAIGVHIDGGVTAAPLGFIELATTSNAAPSTVKYQIQGANQNVLGITYTDSAALPPTPINVLQAAAINANADSAVFLGTPNGSNISRAPLAIRDTGNNTVCTITGDTGFKGIVTVGSANAAAQGDSLITAGGNANDFYWLRSEYPSQTTTSIMTATPTTVSLGSQTTTTNLLGSQVNVSHDNTNFGQVYDSYWNLPPAGPVPPPGPDFVFGNTTSQFVYAGGATYTVPKTGAYVFSALMTFNNVGFNWNPGTDAVYFYLTDNLGTYILESSLALSLVVPPPVATGFPSAGFTLQNLDSTVTLTAGTILNANVFVQGTPNAGTNGGAQIVIQELIS